MIDKTKALTSGYRVMESFAQLNEERTCKIEEMKRIIPSFVNGDGAVDISAIVDFVGQDSTTSNNKGYELTFAGKGLARHLADIKTEKELKIERGQSKNFDETGNVIIRGDNLDALRILRKSYYGKIKMIYIDPPYNTRSDEFIYRDNFGESVGGLIKRLNLEENTLNYIDNMYGTRTHSGWLAFMYPRLKLARDLLTHDGVIFISIDDNEQANLKIMCDEIFGEENFIDIFSWQKTTTPPNLSRKTKKSCEYIIAYQKNESGPLVGLQKSSKNINSPNGLMNRTNSVGNLVFPSNKIATNLPDGIYKAGRYGTKSYDIDLLENTEVRNGYFVQPVKLTGKFKWSQSYLDDSIANGVRVMILTKSFSPSYEKSKYNPEKPWNIINQNFGVGTNENASNELNVLFIPNFSDGLYPKPVSLLKYLISTNVKEGSFVLDFFAGSGTTAQAVMELNKEDNGKRKFILVQWDEEIKQENSKSAYDFCKENNLKPVISSICIERVHRAGEEIKRESDMLNQGMDVGYKVFSLTEAPQLEESENQFQLSHQRQTMQDTLYNMIAASGQDLLTDSIETIEPDLLYKVNDAHYVLGECKTDMKAVGKIFIDGYADISLERWLNMLGLNKENITILY